MPSKLYNLIADSPSFAIYGAQMVAYGAFKAIKHLLGRMPECFIVSADKFGTGNPTEICGVPVRSFDEFADDCAIAKGTLLLVAATEIFQEEICAALVNAGFLNHLRISAHEEHLLMGSYYSSIGKFPFASKNTGFADNSIDFKLFQVQSHADKPLRNQPTLNPWEVPIQAGAALTDSRLCEIADNTGDNISIKNMQYCEVSAMYWIWKNVTADWIGIEHYRRRLLVSPDMLGDDIDAILTLPYMCYPSVLTHQNRYVDDDVINAMLTALKVLYPKEYGHYIDCLNGVYHTAYNLFAAKSRVYSEYCEWVFSITSYMEGLGVSAIRNTRALSYIVELLTSIYFTANHNGLIIKYIEKAIYT